jgi:signal peptidase II
MAENTGQESSRQATSSRPEPGFTWYRDPVLILTVPAIFVLDQLTKYIVSTNLRLGESWPAEGLIRITHGLNTGTAFGLLPNQTLLLVVASFVAIGFLVYFYRTHALPSPLLRLAIGLQLGGAFGNLIDRLRTGAVVDFIDIGWWPIFNIADSSIVVGMAILVGVLLLGDLKRSRSNEESSDQASDGGADE